ncbi:MAG: hypothetical protein F2693_16385 [Actinobacteria bacterium]|nr:hypothetical protein [Actinomycetota bacterium]
MSPLTASAMAVEEVTPALGVSVTVESDDGRFVLGGIELTLFEWIESTEGAGEWVATSDELDPTDEDGAAAFQVTDAGDYMLGFVDPNGEFEPGFGLGGTTQPEGPGAPGTFAFDGVSGDPISLDVALVSIVDPETEDAEVVGLVLDEEGDPIPYVKVEALTAAEPGAATRVVPGTPDEDEYVVYTDYTNDFSQNGNHEPRGGYRLILPPGQYRILFTTEEGETFFYGDDSPEVITTEAGRHYELADSTLPSQPEVPVVALTGKAVDAAGDGMGFEYVELWRVRANQSFDFIDAMDADDEGFFTFQAAPVGKPLIVCGYSRGFGYQICADGKRSLFEAVDSAFEIPVDSTGFTAEEPLLVDPTVDVTVTLKGDKGQPLEDVFVSLIGRDGSRFGNVTNDEGRAVVFDVFPGDHKLCAYPYRSYCFAGTGVPPVQAEQEAAFFAVPGGALSVSLPDFGLPYGGAFTATVADPQGAPVENVRAIVLRFDEELGYFDYVEGSTSGPDGAITARFTEPGDYRFCLQLNGRQDLSCIGADEENYFGTPIDVDESDELLPLGEIAVPEPVMFEGKVVDRDGEPVPYPFLEFRSLVTHEGGSFLPYVGYGDGQEDGSYSIPVFASDEQITACAQRNGFRGCLGGTQNPEEDGTTFVAVDGTVNPIQVADIVLGYSGSAACPSFHGGASFGDGAVLDNGTLTMGAACFGDHVVFNEDYDTEDESGWVGLRLNGQPDAITQGCWCGGWGVADAASGVAGYASQEDTRNLRLSAFSVSEDGTRAASTVAVGIEDGGDPALEVMHESLPSTSSSAYLVRVSITNTGDEEAQLRYRRTVDWDVAPTQFDEIVTTDTGALPEIAFSSNDGFASPNPLSRRDSRGVTGNFTFGPKDQGTLLDFDFGQLLAGETKTFTLAFGGAPSKDEAESILNGLDAQAYSMATASDPSQDTSYFIAYGVDDDGVTDVPVANTDEAAVFVDGSVEIPVLVNDVANADGDLVVLGAEGAVHGAVMCSTTSCSYEHDGGSATSDSFRYTIRNSAGRTDVGRVNITITEAPESAVVDDPPVITPSSDLIEGDVLEVTPATYIDERGTLTRTYDWYLNFGSSPYLFWSGSDTEVELPSWASGATVTVTETAKAAGFKPVSSTSEPTDVVQGVPELYATAYPEFTRTPTQDLPVSLEGAEWASWDGNDDQPETPDAISYRWNVGGELLNSDDDRLSEDGAIFTPTAADVGKWIQVELLATKEGFLPGYAYAYAARIKGEDDRSRVVRVNVTRPDGNDEGVADDAVNEASVWMCSDTGGCYSASLRDGAFEFDVPSSQNGIAYQVSVYPYAGDLLTKSASVSVRNAAQDDDSPQEVTVKLDAIAPPPPSISFPGTSPTRGQGDEAIPMGFIGSPLTPFTATGCTPEETPTWTLTFANGSTPMTGGVSATVENADDPTKVDYTIEIPDLTSSGHATITTNFECDGPISFTIYIDPSGYVTDQFGRTIAGAEVTLLRDLGGANFAPVTDGNTTVMDPNVNDSNPSLTDETGFFRWDVAEGDYRVSVTSATSGGAACAVVTTPTMSVPPERVDLVVKTECEGASTPVPESAPQVTGTREVGRVLSVATGTWDNGIVQTGIQWLRNGNPIAGATGSQYTLVQDDAGTTVTARVTAQRPNYVQENGSGALVSFTPFTSAAVGGGAVTVANPGNPGGGTPTTISNTTKPSISGTAKVSGSLAADPGTWSTEGLTFAYQWLRDGAPIAGATGATYAPVVADLDKSVTLTVTASKSGLTSGTATSDPVTVGKGAAPQNTGAKPLVTGTPEVGESLNVSNGTWDLDELTFAYQWLRDGEPIEGATAATYVVTEGDRGAELTARVTATKAGHEDGSALASGLTVPDEEEPVEPAASTTKATLLGEKVEQGERGQVRVKVTSEGESVPTGTLTVTAGRKSVEVELTEADNGKVKVTLPKLKPGKYEVSVSYSGDDATEGSSDEAGTLKVKEKKKGRKGKGKKADRTGGGRPMAAFL